MCLTAIFIVVKQKVVECFLNDNVIHILFNVLYHAIVLYHILQDCRNNPLKCSFLLLMPVITGCGLLLTDGVAHY